MPTQSTITPEELDALRKSGPFAPGLFTLGTSVFNGLKGMWDQGKEAYNAYQNHDPITAGNNIGQLMAGLGGGGGAAKAAVQGVDDSLMGIFAGLRSRTANIRNLERAKDIEAAQLPGAVGDPEAERAIADLQRRSTGWFPGNEGEYRYEIPDTGAAFNPEAMSKFQEGFYYGGKPESYMRLGDLFNHPELYKAYPEFQDMRVRKTPMFSFDLQGGMDAQAEGGPVMYLSSGSKMFPDTPEKLQDRTSVVLHELQHAVQNKEGFAEGGSSKQFLGPGAKDLEEARKAMRELEKDPIALGQMRDLLTAAHSDLVKNEKYAKSYLNESVARDIQSLTGDLAAGKTPWINMYIRSLANPIVTEPHAWNMEPLLINRMHEILGNQPPTGSPFGLVNRWLPLARKDRELDAMEGTAYSKYKKLAGETEARNVQERFKKNRYDENPWDTQDVPDAEQIIRYGDSIPESASMRKLRGYGR